MNPMKDSGVEWIGEIPEDWEVKKIKYVSSSDDEQVKTQDISFGKIIRYVDIGSVNLTEGITSYQEMSLLDAPSRARKIVRIGDTIVSTVRTYLKAITYIQDEENVVVSTGFSVLRPKQVDRKYFNYCIISDSFTKQVENVAWGIAYPSISNSNLMNLKISYPADVLEQQAIADFLDEETKKLDDAKDLLQKQIEKLKEYRKSLIWETVTKGLDKSVPMKDSGVEWIGKIPESWKLARLKYISTIKSGEFIDKKEFVDDGKYQVIGANGPIGKVNKQNLIEEHIITGRVGTVGTLKLRNNVWITDNVLKIKPNRGISKFIYYFLHIVNFEQLSEATAQPLITATKLNNQVILFPSNSEQQAIADFLDEKTSIIENIISNIQSQIEVIDKQKKTLIYDYVTGKRRVI